jgi:hypothetical protein
MMTTTTSKPVRTTGEYDFFLWRSVATYWPPSIVRTAKISILWDERKPETHYFQPDLPFSTSRPTLLLRFPSDWSSRGSLRPMTSNLFIRLKSCSSLMFPFLEFWTDWGQVGWRRRNHHFLIQICRTFKQIMIKVNILDAFQESALNLTQVVKRANSVSMKKLKISPGFQEICAFHFPFEKRSTHD